MNNDSFDINSVDFSTNANLENHSDLSISTIDLEIKYSCESSINKPPPLAIFEEEYVSPTKDNTYSIFDGLYWIVCIACIFFGGFFIYGIFLGITS